MARAPRRDELRPRPSRSASPRKNIPANNVILIGAISFAATFGLTRLVTHAIRDGKGPFRNITPAAATSTT